MSVGAADPAEIPAAPPRRDNPRLGIALMIATSLVFACPAAFTRCDAQIVSFKSASTENTRSPSPLKISISLNPRYVIRLPFTMGVVSLPVPAAPSAR